MSTFDYDVVIIGSGFGGDGWSDYGRVALKRTSPGTWAGRRAADHVERPAAVPLPT